MKLFEKIFGTHSENELKRIYPIADRIEAMEADMQKLSDEELKNKTNEFKERLANGETLDDILPEAYAVVREAATRVLGMRHYEALFQKASESLFAIPQSRIFRFRIQTGKSRILAHQTVCVLSTIT